MIPRHSVAVHIQELAVVWIAHPAVVLRRGGGVGHRGRGEARALHPRQGRRRGLEVVAGSHGEAAEDEAGVVQEQPVVELQTNDREDFSITF